MGPAAVLNQAKGPEGSTIDSRIETVATKPAFRTAFKKRSCVIPMAGYYEWSVSPIDGKKDPWFIHAAEPLLAAGLWEDSSPPVARRQLGNFHRHHRGQQAAACRPTSTTACRSGYKKSLLMCRTLTAHADISAAAQVWGIGFVLDSAGTVLDSPAAIVDGAAGQLRVYRWNGTTAPGAAAAEIAVPWTLAGSQVRLDMHRSRFSTKLTLINRKSGEKVELVLDYGAGTWPIADGLGSPVPGVPVDVCRR